MHRLVVVFAVVLEVLAVSAASAVAQAPPGRPAPGRTAVSEDTVQQVASQLRCVVCQNLSVADSPSEMAAQMRGLVRERLEAGDTPDQVTRYFVEKYGEWILLEPPRHGFNWLVWGFPVVAVLFGLVAVGLLLRRWTRRPAAVGAGGPAVDTELRERIRREMEKGT